MTHYYPDLQKHSFSRSPDWRWRRANYLVDQGRRVFSDRDDADTAQAVRFLRWSARWHKLATADHQFGAVYAAHQLHLAGGHAAWHVQARLLAREEPAEIARHTGIPVGIVDHYERLFFHCSDRLGARDWVVAQLIGPGQASPPDPAAVLKSFAYFGGPLVLDAVRPYLIGGQQLFDPFPDDTTVNGRRELSVQLAVAAQTLPNNAATDRLIERIHLLLYEGAPQGQGPATSATSPARYAGPLTADLVPPEDVRDDTTFLATTVAAALRQAA
jgi:hypothetical protein